MQQEQLPKKKVKEPAKKDQKKTKKIELPDVEEILLSAEKVLEITQPIMVCRVCGEEHCHCYPKIPKEEFIPGKWSY